MCVPLQKVTMYIPIRPSEKGSTPTLRWLYACGINSSSDLVLKCRGWTCCLRNLHLTFKTKLKNSFKYLKNILLLCKQTRKYRHSKCDQCNLVNDIYHMASLLMKFIYINEFVYQWIAKVNERWTKHTLINTWKEVCAHVFLSCHFCIHLLNFLCIMYIEMWVNRIWA